MGSTASRHSVPREVGRSAWPAGGEEPDVAQCAGPHAPTPVARLGPQPWRQPRPLAFEAVDPADVGGVWRPDPSCGRLCVVSEADWALHVWLTNTYVGTDAATTVASSDGSFAPGGGYAPGGGGSGPQASLVSCQSPQSPWLSDGGAAGDAADGVVLAPVPAPLWSTGAGGVGAGTGNSTAELATWPASWEPVAPSAAAAGADCSGWPHGGVDSDGAWLDGLSAAPLLVSELALEAPLGAPPAAGVAACGTPQGAPAPALWRGRWRGTPVAVKVLATQGCQATAARHAVELAVSGAVLHPNVQAVYAYYTDVTYTSATPGAGPGPGASGAASGARAGPARRFQRLLPGEGEAAPDGPLNLLVLEVCEGGSLEDLLARGPLGMGRAVEVLADAAAGLAHLHAMRVVHGRVQAPAVLLKPEAGRSCGLVAKLSDLSACAMLDEAGNVLTLVTSTVSGSSAEPPASSAAARAQGASDCGWSEDSNDRVREMVLARQPPTPDAPTLANDTHAFGVLIRDVLACTERPSSPADAVTPAAAAGASVRGALVALSDACCKPLPPAMADIASRLDDLAAALAHHEALHR